MGEPKRVPDPMDNPVWLSIVNSTPACEEEREAIEYVRVHGLHGVPGEQVSAELAALIAREE